MSKYVTALVLAAMSVPASAQYYDGNLWIGQGNMMGDHIMQNHITNQALDRIEEKKRNTPHFPEGDISALRFTPSVARQRANQIAFAQALVERSGASTDAAKLLFSTAGVIPQTFQAMQERGLDGNNVADCYAVYLIGAWEVVHNRRADKTDTLYESVRRQAEVQLRNVPKLMTASNADKQDFADVLLLQSFVNRLSMLERGSDPAQMVTLSRQIAAQAKGLGVDLETMELNDQGLVPHG